KFPSLIKHNPNPNTYGSAGPCGEANGARAYNQYFNGPSVYPEYLTDPAVQFCPSDPDAEGLAEENQWFVPVTQPCHFSEASYTYYGYAIMEDMVLASGVGENRVPADIDMAGFGPAMLNAFTTAAGGQAYGDRFEADISIDTTGKTIYRLREGIERFFISDINNPAATAMAQSEVPVMWDTIWSPSVQDGFNFSYFSHVPGGGNALYMDGHVKFLRYPSEWPVSTTMPSMMDAFDAL
ncbi:MAG: hypothetical protein GY851_25275, partial [bacterium]|nr:hypothetical protein [bacterium]